MSREQQIRYEEREHKKELKKRLYKKVLKVQWKYLNLIINIIKHN